MKVSQGIIISNARKCSIKPLVIGGRSGVCIILYYNIFCIN